MVNNSPGIIIGKVNKNGKDDDEEEKDKDSKDNKDDKDKKDKEKDKKTVFTEGSDEMDNTRLKVNSFLNKIITNIVHKDFIQKRFELYHSCARPFLEYFNETGRLITVEVAPQQKEHVWKRMNDLLRDYGFNSKKSSRTVVLFATSNKCVSITN